jgi:GT2 family glycosyltransferase
MNFSSISNTHEATIIPAPSTIVPWDDELRVPDISVIIVSWNSKDFLEQCLESLAVGSVRPYEVIVVDNDSKDGSPEAVTRKFPWVRLVRAGANLGFAKANNLGIRHSRGTYIALVNSDVKVHPECLDKLADFLDVNPGVGMVGPRIFFGDGRPQSSCRRFPSLWNNACEIFGLNKIFPRSAFFAGEHMFYFGYDRTCEVDVLVGCFIMARSTAVAEFGLLDEEFFMYCEDVDWARRCGFAGWKVMFYPAAKAVHRCGGSSMNEPLRFAVAQEQSRLKLWAKHHSRTVACMFVILATIGHGIRILFAAMKAILNSEERPWVAESVRTHISCLRVLWGGAPRDVPK